MVERGDAVAAGVLPGQQVAPQNGVVSDAEEGHHAVPRLVVEPHLSGVEVSVSDDAASVP